MPTTTYVPYASRDDLASFLRITNSEDDSDLAAAVSSASRTVDAHCGYDGPGFLDADDTATPRVFAARDNEFCYVDPISSTDGLVVKTGTSPGSYPLTWASTDYQLWPLNGRAAGLADHAYYRLQTVAGRRFPCSGSLAMVEVTAKWGWLSGPPDPVKHATMLVAKYLFEERNTLSGFAFGADGASAFTAGGLSARVKEMLQPFKRWSMP